MGQFHRGETNFIFQGHWQISLAKSVVQIWSLAGAILRLQFSRAHQYMATLDSWLYPISAKYLSVHLTANSTLDWNTIWSASQNGVPCATCKPLGFADEGSVPREECISKKFHSGLLDSSSESFTRTLIAVLKKPQKECNNLFFTVKMGASPLQAISLQLKTCWTSDLGSRFAFAVVHGTTGGHKVGKDRVPLPSSSYPSVTATAAVQQNAPGFQKVSDTTRKKPEARCSPIESRGRLLQVARDSCPRLQDSWAHTGLHMESTSTHPRTKPAPPPSMVYALIFFLRNSKYALLA